MGSLEDNFVYALVGKLNLMLYPYITSLHRTDCQRHRNILVVYCTSMAQQMGAIMRPLEPNG